MDRDSGSSHSSNIHNRECLVCMGYVDTGDGIETDFGVSEKQKTGNGPDLWRDIRYPFT